MPGQFSLSDVSHVIQVALVPAFLLSGLASLLNVFSTRLGRVADQVDALAARVAGADREEAEMLSQRLAHLRTRSLLLDFAVVLGSLGGALVGTSILTMFVGALRDDTIAWALFACFGGAIACTIGALGLFLIEILISGQGMRLEVAAKREEADETR